MWWGLEVSRPACNYGGEKGSGDLVGRWVWGVGALFRVESSACGLLKLGFLENAETRGDLGVEFT